MGKFGTVRHDDVKACDGFVELQAVAGEGLYDRRECVAADERGFKRLQIWGRAQAE